MTLCFDTIGPGPESTTRYDERYNRISLSKDFGHRRRGFLGRFVGERLKSFPDVEVFLPRSSPYNLVQGAKVKRLLADAKPDMVIHLAAVVGGIGAQSEKPGSLFRKKSSLKDLHKTSTD